MDESKDFPSNTEQNSVQPEKNQAGISATGAISPGTWVDLPLMPRL